MKIHQVQQNSPEWYALRIGRPTASEFSSIVTSAGEPSKSRSGYAKTLAAELFAGRPVDKWQGNQWTDRGHELEAQAIAYYEFLHDVDVERVGFITDDAETVGCSPDGLVGDRGGVEVKSLKAERHIEVLEFFRKHNRAPSDYIVQPQGSMWITGRAWWDLLFFHPELPTFIIRQEPIFQVIGGLASGVREVIAERDNIVAMLRGMSMAA
jgi:hypothetical protein